MKKELNVREAYYRSTMGNLGLVMCVFLLLFHGGVLLLSFFSDFLILLSVSDVAYTVIYDLTYGAFYLLAFMLPVLLLKQRIRGEGRQYRPMYAEARISPYLPLMIFAVVFLVRASSCVNAAWVSLFDVADDGSYWYSFYEMAPYEIVLSFIVTCVVPGFCEEFLFRGAILTNCLPFGRTNAIIISSILFALMHQNAAQIFYTFIAGILFGIVYEKTGSIWNCVVLHIFNNLFSLVDEVIYYNLYSYSAVLAPLWEAVICLVGAISVGFLAVRFFSKNTDLEEGIYQRELPACDSYAAYPVALPRATQLFFAPAMIAYLILSVVTNFTF